MKSLYFASLMFIVFHQTILAEEIIFPGKFKVSMDKEYFMYQDQFITEKIPVKKCNEDIFKSALSLFEEKKSKNIAKIRSPKKIKFLKDNRPIEVSTGSKVHHNLDSFNKKVQGYISRARSKCSK